MVALAVGALVFAGLACVAGGSGGRHSVLVEEFLECSQGLHLEFDEVIEFFVVLGTDGIDKFCSGCQDKIGGVVGERCGCVHMIFDAIAGGLASEFASVVLGELSYDEWAKLGESLVALGFGFPFLDGGVESTGAFDSSFEECEAMVWISGNANLLMLLLDLVIAFKFGGRGLGWIPSIVHGADEFLDVDVIQPSTVGAEVVEDFYGCAVSEAQTFTAKV